MVRSSSRRIWWRALGVGPILIALFLALTGCPAGTSNSSAVKVVLIPADGGTASGTLADFQPLFATLSESTGMTFDLSVTQSYSAAVEALCSRYRVHAAGFLGWFYADAIEDAEQKPVEALRATGASRLVTFAMAIVPQVRAPFASSTLYILDRNVRMAAVIGIVGAGGIGQELKGRIDMYDYGHVSTIILAIFIVVLALDEIAVRLRRHT